MTTGDVRLDRYGSAMALAAGTLICVLVLSGVRLVTAERTEAVRTRQLAETLDTVLADLRYDNTSASDFPSVSHAALGSTGPRRVHRAFRGNQPAGAALSVIAPDGYSGAIVLLVGVDIEARILAVRVVEHRETPGLGDRIEQRRSDWILQFNGRSVHDDSDRVADWTIVSRGSGRGFDALTGATITSRAVVDAVYRAVTWFETHRDSIFDS